MWFLIIGLVLLAMHFAGIGPPAEWTFKFTGDLWKFALPFALAVAWWWFADFSGLTQRRAMRQMDERKAERRNKAVAALGLDDARSRADRTGAFAQRGRADQVQPTAPSRRDPTQG